jgi:hypothetical protein
MRPVGPLSVTYGNVTATLALFIALGGGAYAVTALPPRSVGTRQLKPNAVVRSKIAANAVTGSRILDNSVTGADIRESTLGRVPSAALADTAVNAISARTATTAKTAATATTAANAVSATRAAHATHAAAAGALDKATYETATGAVPPPPAYGTPATPATAYCDAGQHVIGGGARVDDTTVASVVDQYPDANDTAWTARVLNPSRDTQYFTVYAICITVSSTG